MKCFLFASSLHEWITVVFNFHLIQNFHFLTNGKVMITASVKLRSTTSITTLTLWGHYYGKEGLSEQKRGN